MDMTFAEVITPGGYRCGRFASITSPAAVPEPGSVIYEIDDGEHRRFS